MGLRGGGSAGTRWGAGTPCLADLGGYVPPPVVAGNPLWRCQFDKGTGSTGAAAFPEVVSLQEDTLGRISRKSAADGITLPPGESYAADVLCGPNDHFATPIPNQRTEIYLRHFTTSLGAGSLEGKDIWVAWDYFLVPGFAFGTWVVITQFHSGYGSPLFALAITSAGVLEIDVRGGASVANSGPASSRFYSVQKPVTVGAWQEAKVHFKFSTTSGYCYVWLNGQPVLAETGQPTLEVGYENASYHKAGIYRGGPANESGIRFANVRHALAETDL